MDREGAETYLRLLGEARLRGLVAGEPWPSWAAGPGGGRARMTVVGEALAAVGALDAGTASDIVADFDLAVGVRQLPAGPGGSAPLPGAVLARWPTAPSAARLRPGPRRAIAAAPPGTAAAPPGTAAAPPGTAAAPPGTAAAPGLAVPAPGAPGSSPAGAGAGSAGAGAGEEAVDRLVPVGTAVRFAGADVRGELYLMVFVQTGAGARFVAQWVQRGVPSGPPPLGQVTITDDRGRRYQLEPAGSDGPEWTTQVGVNPAPAAGVRWLDVAGTGPAVRVELPPEGAPACPAAPVGPAALSPGEHLLIQLAEQLLTIAPPFAADFRRLRHAVSPGPVQAMTAGLGDIVGGLHAAGVLPPASPVPARLAALCASLGIADHGIAAVPAPELPEPWLSLLAHYQRRKPEVAPVRDGYAPVAAVLPELDAIRLALLGLSNSEGNSSLHVLACGMSPAGQPGMLGLDLDFPLSVWLLDSGGRWHAARPAGWYRFREDYVIRLRLIPPFTRPADWVEVLAAGHSMQTRARLPLRWGSAYAGFRS